jgi:hypothetical protein
MIEERLLELETFEEEKKRSLRFGGKFHKLFRQKFTAVTSKLARTSKDLHASIHALTLYAAVSYKFS